MSGAAAAQPQVTFTVNGRQHVVAAGTRLGAWLVAQGIDLSRAAVERNGEVVPRARLPEVVLADGDIHEVVHFVGGG